MDKASFGISTEVDWGSVRLQGRHNTTDIQPFNHRPKVKLRIELQN